MTPKQQRFCQEYLIDLNATQAAIRAGYSEATAYSQGPRLLGYVEVQAQIAALQGKFQERGLSRVDRVLREFDRIAFFDIRKAFDSSGNLRPIQELDDDTAAAIAGVDTDELFAGSGEARGQIGNTRKIKAWDKVKALDSLARHLGLFAGEDDINRGTQVVLNFNIPAPGSAAPAIPGPLALTITPEK